MHPIWRLSEAGPDNLGLAVCEDGLLLGKTPLVERRGGRFVVRERDEIERLLRRGHRSIGEADRLMPGLALVARALNANDQCLARIAAVHLKLPDLPGPVARDAMEAEDRLIKYGSAEWDPAKHPRTGEPPNPGWFAPTGGEGEDAPRVHLVENDDSTRRSDASPVIGDSNANATESGDKASLNQEFEQRYDHLGPVDFAKEVIQFGSWLEREGANLSPAERERALAEYSFLQDRLSFWLGYDYKPPRAQANLISAALTLFQGAVNGGLVRAGEMPQSMLDVGGAAWAADNIPPRTGSSIKPAVEELSVAPVKAPGETEGIGGVVNNSEAKIPWGKGIKQQGGQWEDYLADNSPDDVKLDPTAKTFDLFDPTTREATSAKTLNALSVFYINNPEGIFQKLRGYVDSAMNYQPYRRSDLDPADISSKTIQLAIPEYTSPEQWQYLQRAIIYGKENGVSIVITRIRE